MFRLVDELFHVKRLFSGCTHAHASSRFDFMGDMVYVADFFDIGFMLISLLRFGGGIEMMNSGRKDGEGLWELIKHWLLSGDLYFSMHIMLMYKI